MRILIFLLAVCVSYTSAFEECRIGINLLVVDNTDLQSKLASEEGTNTDESQAAFTPAWTVLQKSTLTYQLDPTVSALGDGLSITGQLPSTTDNAPMSIPRLPTRLSQRLQCTLPTAAIDSYDVELSILAHNISQPDHSYLLLTAKPILEEESNDDVHSPNIADVQVRFSGRPGSEPVTLPFSSSISRVPLSPRIKSFDFVLDFDDIIVFSPENSISVVLVPRTNGDTADRLLMVHSKEPKLRNGDSLLPRASSNNNKEMKLGLVPEEKVTETLNAMQWNLFNNDNFFQAPIVNVLDSNGLFDLTVSRQTDKTQQVFTPFVMKSNVAVHPSKPFALAVTAQLYIANEESEDDDNNNNNKESTTTTMKNAAHPPSIEIGLVVHSSYITPSSDVSDNKEEDDENNNKKDTKNTEVHYVSLHSTYIVTAKDFPVLSATTRAKEEESTTTTSSSELSYVDFTRIVHVPMTTKSVDFIVTIQGGNTHSAHVRNMSVRPIFLQVSVEDPTGMSRVVITLVVCIAVAGFVLLVLIGYVMYDRKRRGPDVHEYNSDSLNSTKRSTTGKAVDETEDTFGTLIQ